jgi:hypothetical protein
MNHKVVLLSIAVTGVLLSGTAATSSAQDMPKPKTNASFEQLKSLTGEWEGSNAEGNTARLEYQVVSNGTALMERLHPAGEVEMVTMYSPDGPRVAVTHYCSSGNQPQMRTEALAAPAQKLTFEFVRASNLESPAAGHMGQLVLTMQDHDHFTQEWSWMENGKVAHRQVFHFTRKS